MRIIFISLVIGMSAIVVWPDSTLALAKGAVKGLEYYIDGGGKTMTKVQAAKTMIVDSGAAVYRCYRVEMSNKLTIVKKKK